jgi:cysteinyl-tRNA synthetase
MSKSLGNLVSVDEALEHYDADSLRLYFLSSHYRSPLQFSDEGCAAMARSAERLRHALTRNGGGTDEPLNPMQFQTRFLEAMDDDLNTPRALASLFDLAREINRARDSGRSVSEAQDTLSYLGSILGLSFQARELAGEDHLAAKPFIDLLLDTRAELRRAKQYALADQIREGLDRQGVILEDTPEGTGWKYQPPQ